MVAMIRSKELADILNLRSEPSEDAVIVNINHFHFLRPSIYRVNNISILEHMQIEVCDEYLFLDTLILDTIIHHMVINYRGHAQHNVKVNEEILNLIFTKIEDYLFTYGTHDDNYTSIMHNYISLVSEYIQVSIRPHVPYDTASKKVYECDVSIYGTDTTADIRCVLKIASNRHVVQI